MLTNEWFVYRTVRVSRNPQGADIVIGDSEGDPRAHSCVDAHLALYLTALGREGWEVCGALAHASDASARGSSDGSEATILLKRRIRM